MNTASLLHQSRSYTSARTNTISALFAKKKINIYIRGEKIILPQKLILWEGVVLSAPRQAASLAWAGLSHQAGLGFNHQPKRLWVSSPPFSSEAGHVGDAGQRRCHVGTAMPTQSARPLLSSARRDPSLARGRRGQTGGRELAFLL